MEDLDGFGSFGRGGGESHVVCEEVLSLRCHEWGVGLQGLGGEAVLDLGVQLVKMAMEALADGLTNFFCCINISFGQSYTTPLPNTGVVKCYLSAKVWPILEARLTHSVRLLR